MFSHQTLFFFFLVFSNTCKKCTPKCEVLNTFLCLWLFKISLLVLPCTMWFVGAFLIQVTTRGGIQAGAPGSSKLFVTSWVSTASNWKSCRSSHVSTTWWQLTLSPGLKTHASVRRSRFPVLSLCWPKSFILTDNYITSEFLYDFWFPSFLFFIFLFYFSVLSTLSAHISISQSKLECDDWHTDWPSGCDHMVSIFRDRPGHS